MAAENKDNVVLVFELACDIHWMKDVAQFPNAIAQNLLKKKAILIARPNHRQLELIKHINLVYLDGVVMASYNNFETFNYSGILYDPKWYLSACKMAARLGSVLVLYPFYGNAFMGAKYFKLKRWLMLRDATVIIKSDGTLNTKSKIKASFKEWILDFFRYLFVDKIICENKETYDNIKKNQKHLAAKVNFIPNCPLDIYHNQPIIPYCKRPDNFLFAGRVDDMEKGADILLNAWMKVCKKIPGWNLQIAGLCSENFKNEWLIKLAKIQASNTVNWLGTMEPEELMQCYSQAKIVVCSSRKESGPIVLSEAILSGCAFIGTNVGEIPDILKDLPGLVMHSDELDKQLLYFALNPRVAESQNGILHEKMKNRKWNLQVEKIFK